MQELPGLLYFTLQMAWRGDNGGGVEGDTAFADLLEEWSALGLVAPIRLHPIPACVVPS